MTTREQPYWLRGFYDLAALTGEERLLAQSKRWMEAVLASQDEDGDFGPKCCKCVVGENGRKVCDLWPHMIILDAVITHYEHTGEERAIRFMGALLPILSPAPRPAMDRR